MAPTSGRGIAAALGAFGAIHSLGARAHRLGMAAPTADLGDPNGPAPERPTRAQRPIDPDDGASPPGQQGLDPAYGDLNQNGYGAGRRWRGRKKSGKISSSIRILFLSRLLSSSSPHHHILLWVGGRHCHDDPEHDGQIHHRHSRHMPPYFDHRYRRRHPFLSSSSSSS